MSAAGKWGGRVANLPLGVGRPCPLPARLGTPVLQKFTPQKLRACMLLSTPCKWERS